MSQQAIRQAARRAALDGLSRRRAERAEQEKHLEALAVRVLVAVRERDAAVAEHERRAGEALREMTDSVGLSLRDAVEWCGGEVTAREATRLRRLVNVALAPVPKAAPEMEESAPSATRRTESTARKSRPE